MGKLTLYQVNNSLGFDRITQEESNDVLYFLRKIIPELKTPKDSWETLRGILEKFNTTKILFMKTPKFELVYDLNLEKSISFPKKIEDEDLIYENIKDSDISLIAFGYDLSEKELTDFLRKICFKLVSDAYVETGEILKETINEKALTMTFDLTNENSVARDYNYDTINCELTLESNCQIKCRYITKVIDYNETYSEPDVGYFNVKNDDETKLEEFWDEYYITAIDNDTLIYYAILYLFDSFNEGFAITYTMDYLLETITNIEESCEFKYISD